MRHPSSRSIDTLQDHFSRAIPRMSLPQQTRARSLLRQLRLNRCLSDADWAELLSLLEQALTATDCSDQPAFFPFRQPKPQRRADRKRCRYHCVPWRMHHLSFGIRHIRRRFISPFRPPSQGHTRSQ